MERRGSPGKLKFLSDPTHIGTGMVSMDNSDSMILHGVDLKVYDWIPSVLKG